MRAIKSNKHLDNL